MRAALLCLWLLAGAALADAPTRVISLAPSMTEMVVELGADDLLVGVLDGVERPAKLDGLPSVGRYGQLDMERLLALQPDLLLLWPGSVPPAQRDQLQRLGLPTFSAEPHTLDELIEQIQALAMRLGRGERGSAHAEALRKRLAALRERYHRAQPLRVFYQVWDKPLYTLGGRQIVSDALATCGARNIFADLPQPAPQVSVESVLVRDPQVLLLSDASQRASWQAWPALLARVAVVPDKGLERPSGQMIEATAQLCAVLDATAPGSR